MDPAQRGQLAFILALVGGVFNLLTGLLFGAMGLFLTALLGYADAADAPPAWLFSGFFGFFAVVAIAGGVTLLVCAPRLRRPMPESRGAAIGAIVGGAMCLVSGNVVSAGLGVAAGVVVLAEPGGAR